MSYRGTVKNGVVVLEPGAVLPDGTSVRVEPEQQPVISDEELDPAWRMDELAGATGLSDLSVNIDHYLYGHPKVKDAK
jgi:hypothetical protein